MPALSVRYGFNQYFDVPASDAYKWSTDYHPNDLSLMGEKGQRKIKWISDDAIILTDTVYQDGKPIEKKKIIRLDGANLSWSNTHLSGPNRYSQFLYRIVPEGEGSRLFFTGLQLNHSNTKISQQKSGFWNTRREKIMLQRGNV